MTKLPATSRVYSLDTLMPVMRKLAKMWDKVPNHVRENDTALWNQVYTTWHKIMAAPPKGAT